jgi:hypothetical protein
MEASFEVVGQGPKGPVAPYMDACMVKWMDGWMVTDKPEGGFGDLKIQLWMLTI